MEKKTQTRWNGLLLLMALGLLMSIAFFILSNNDTLPEPEPTVVGDQKTPTATLTITAEFTPSSSPSPYVPPSLTPFPTAAPEQISTLADMALDATPQNILIRQADAYTVYDGAERTGIVFYTVQRGDHLRDIAAYFGLQMETIIWSNERFYVNAMRPGMELTILPTDGALHYMIEPITIQALADQYQVDPYAIIDSDFNQLKDATPNSVLPVGLAVVIPDGIGSQEPIYWEPSGGVSSDSKPQGSFGATSIYEGHAKFGDGQSGSCGTQPIYGGTMPSVGPVSGYVVTQDFGWSHGGIDLSVPEGTPVKAVGGGTIIFAGWSDWGYGYSIVIAHGPVMSLYAHLNGVAWVWCGMQVEAGQHIANSGNTGRSSGPHLHFEIRNAAGVPQNPRDYLWFADLRGPRNN
jgi:murein DD-endopeptidase MepM/ murein hydrolase activator NlpD